MMDQLLHLLRQNKTATRDELCAWLAISGPALFERVAALKRAGYPIEDEGGERFSLLSEPNALLPGLIMEELSTQWVGRAEILYAPEMGSTNTVLKQAAMARALPPGSIAVCHRQTAGKGRLQRVWEDDVAGASLTVSLLLMPNLPPEQMHLMTLAVAVAAADTLVEQGVEAGIKWPNDVVIGPRKCAGILCELFTDFRGRLCAVAGIGVNIGQRGFSPSLRDKATSLYIACGREIGRRALLCAFLLHMEQTLARLEAQGLAGILPGYLERSVTIGSRVRVVGAAEEFVGTAERIDELGALLVRDDAGTLRQVLSGDVSVRGVMGYV